MARSPLEVVTLSGMHPLVRLTVMVACCVVALVPTAGSVLAADGPRLDAPKCTPTSGTTSTVFRFSIVYYGTVEPSGYDVHIDSFGSGSIFAMTKIGPGPNGGILYAYDTRLGVGTHQYRFHFKVGTEALRKPGPTGSNWYSGPTVTAGTEKCAISGLIKANDVGLAGVEVRLAKAGGTAVTVRTNTEGRYAATGLAAGTYTVTPAKAGYRMDPLSKTVTVPASTTTCNFRAIRR